MFFVFCSADGYDLFLAIAIGGPVVAIFLIIGITACCCWCCCYRRRQDQREREERYIRTGEHFDDKERKKQEEKKKNKELNEPLITASENRAKMRAKWVDKKKGRPEEEV